MTGRHVIIVGSGIAGLYASLLAADDGANVTLLTKGQLEHSNTHHAQGGISAVLPAGRAAPGDTVASHIADTLRAGAGCCDPEAVRILCAEAAEDMSQLVALGVRFDSDGGRTLLGLEGAHSAPRILHAGGDATGAGIAGALISAVLSRASGPDGTRITVLPEAFLVDVLSSNAGVTGVRYLHRDAVIDLAGDAVLLATGGAGQLFEHTTNPDVATADGLAAGWRAGAVVADLEFFQFHPTALALEGNFLISEAVRGAGAVLRDADGRRFMPDYYPLAELAPRDVVARSIVAHLRERGDDPAGCVYLDATEVEARQGAGFLASRFPTIDAATRSRGLDWTREWLPVAPAAHYWMGGLATDTYGRTSLPGLYAAGEVACTGVHGANRLASNSLLEGLVFARRAVLAMLAPGQVTAPNFAAEPLMPGPEDATQGESDGQLQSRPQAERMGTRFERGELRRLMAQHAGAFRTDAGLAVAAKQLAAWQPPASPPTDMQADTFEKQNLLLAAQLLVAAARRRTQSVGAHYRSDESAPIGHDRQARQFFRRAGFSPSTAKDQL
ncbi:MAG: L-aspartate oxidase [Micrococcaceae bacterium]|nr:L-aspartate oxidase [Micrococcaceae bacterium]